ncbi:MAG: hypothetical protein Q9191_000214 [Dirinaria sp. TL-2023a]
MSSTDKPHLPDPSSGQVITAQDDSPTIGLRDVLEKPVSDNEKQVDLGDTAPPQRCPEAPTIGSNGDIKPVPIEVLLSPTQQVPVEDGSTVHVVSQKTPALSLPDRRKSAESSSVANSTTTQPTPAPKDSTFQPSHRMEYSVPTPKTSRTSQSPPRGPKDQPSLAKRNRRLMSATGNQSVTGSDVASKTEHDEIREVQRDEGSQSEIQSIMEQFDGEGKLHEEGIASPKQETGSPREQVSLKFPLRTSSLDPMGSVSSGSGEAPTSTASKSNYPSDMDNAQTSPSGTAYFESSSIQRRTSPRSAHFAASEALIPPSPQSSRSLPTALPPEPDPEPDLPFDFHRFLEQLRHRTADPVAKFLRSFLIEFGKKQWMVHEQVKIICDFLAFITNKMAQCEVWRGVSDAEFDNAKEGMEKLVMNRLYTQTFSPAIPPPTPVQDGKGKAKDLEKLRGPSRRGQHQEDIERDEILGQKVRIYRWVQEEHLDIAPVGESGRRFLSLAQQELLKIKTYRAPRDKVICVLNCCKVIFGLLRNAKFADTSADSFVPLLIYVVLRANPEHLVSNIQYILRFRNQEKLSGEAGYYLSSLMGAIQFIENLDRTSLTISDQDFEKNVEQAVSVIAEKHKEAAPRPPHLSEKSALSEPEIIPRNSTEVEYATPRRPLALSDSKEQYGLMDGSEESSAVNGLLRTIQKPLSSIGRMFSEESATARKPGDRGRLESAVAPEPPPRLSPAVFQPPRNSGESCRTEDEHRQDHIPEQAQTHKISAEDAAARQASAEAAEAQRIQRTEHSDVVEYGC